MFIFDNGRVCVYCESRCGHTSLYKHFGIPVYSIGQCGIDNWVNTKSKRVLVLRHPYDRVTSAFLMLYRNLMSQEDFETNFINHTKPYMAELLSCVDSTLDFQYIDFDKLNNFVEMDYANTTITNSRYRKHIYIYNDAYSKKDLEQEYDLYLQIKQMKQEITVQEWEELTK